MTRKYKGYTLEAKRERCMGGYYLLYYSIFRDIDGYECLCSYEDSSEKVVDKIKQLKERVDNEHLEEDPWCEKEELIFD